mgnify:CR=1 FL=1
MTAPAEAGTLFAGRKRFADQEFAVRFSGRIKIIDGAVAIDRELDSIYAAFTAQVRDSRKLDDARLDDAARGRVFSGSDARQAGLVDELGGLATAIDLAKAKSGIAQNATIELRRFPLEGNRWQKLLDRAMRLTGTEMTAPQLRLPREMRDALARDQAAQEALAREPMVQGPAQTGPLPPDSQAH